MVEPIRSYATIYIYTYITMIRPLNCLCDSQLTTAISNISRVCLRASCLQCTLHGSICIYIVSAQKWKLGKGYNRIPEIKLSHLLVPRLLRWLNQLTRTPFWCLLFCICIGNFLAWSSFRTITRLQPWYTANIVKCKYSQTNAYELHHCILHYCIIYHA